MALRAQFKAECLVDEKMIPLCASPTIKELCFSNHFFFEIGP